jgi:uncharacterized OB-fold protein
MPKSDFRPFTAASFNQYLNEKKLMASRCTACGALHLPPRAICPKCHGETMEWAEASGRGRLAAFTSVYIGLTAMNAEGYSRDNPYCSGVVELEEGVKISARVLGVDAKNPASIQIGAPLMVEFVEHSEGEEKKTVLAFRV